MRVRCGKCRRKFALPEARLNALRACPLCKQEATFELVADAAAADDTGGEGLSLVDEDAGASDSSETLPVGGAAPYGSAPKPKAKPLRPKPAAPVATHNVAGLSQSINTNQTVNVIVQGAGGGGPSTPASVVIGFLCNLFCLFPLGLLICVIGYGEAKRRGAGKGLAIAGIVIGALGTLGTCGSWIIPLMIGAAVGNANSSQTSDAEVREAQYCSGRYGPPDVDEGPRMEPSSRPQAQSAGSQSDPRATQRQASDQLRTEERVRREAENAERERQARRQAAERAIESARDVEELEDVMDQYRELDLESRYKARRAKILAAQREDTLQRIGLAATAGEAEFARRRYTHDDGADELDRALVKRIEQLDGAQMEACLDAVRRAANYEELDSAAALYTGTAHKSEVDRAVLQRASALESPTLSALRDEAKKLPDSLVAMNALLKRLRAFSKRSTRYAKDVDTLVAEIEKKQRPHLEDARLFEAGDTQLIAKALTGWEVIQGSVRYNGTIVAAAGTDETGRTAVMLLDAASLKILATHFVASRLNEVDLATNAAVVVTRSGDVATAIVWDGKNATVRDLCADGATCCGVFPDGKRIVIGRSYFDKDEGHVHRPLMYNSQSGKLTNEPRVSHKSGLLAIAPATSGKGFVTIDRNGGMGYWDSDGKLVFQYAARQDRAESTYFGCTSSGLAIGEAGALKFYSLSKDAELFSLSGFAGDVCCATSSANARYLAAADSRGLVRIFDAKSRSELKSFDLRGALIVTMHWSADGLTLYAVTLEGTVHSFRAPRG